MKWNLQSATKRAQQRPYVDDYGASSPLFVVLMIRPLTSNRLSRSTSRILGTIRVLHTDRQLKYRSKDLGSPRCRKSYIQTRHRRNHDKPCSSSPGNGSEIPRRSRQESNSLHSRQQALDNLNHDKRTHQSRRHLVFRPKPAHEHGQVSYSAG